MPMCFTYRTLFHKTSLKYKPNVRDFECLRFEWIFCPFWKICDWIIFTFPVPHWILFPTFITGLSGCTYVFSGFKKVYVYNLIFLNVSVAYDGREG